MVLDVFRWALFYKMKGFRSYFTKWRGFMFSGHPYPCIFITSHPCSPIFIHFHPFSLRASKSLLGSNFWQPMQALHFVVDFEADTSYILSYILCQFVFMRRSFSGGTKGRLLNSTQRWRMLLIVGALLASISGRSWWSRQPRICNWKLQRPTSCRFLTIQCTQRISKICFDFLFVKLLLYIDVYCCNMMYYIDVIWCILM